MKAIELLSRRSCFALAAGIVVVGCNFDKPPVGKEPTRDAVAAPEAAKSERSAESERQQWARKIVTEQSKPTDLYLI